MRGDICVGDKLSSGGGGLMVLLFALVVGGTVDAALNQALVAACLLPDTGARNIDSLLNQQILPVLSQQLLQRQAARQKTIGVRLGYSDVEGIVLHFLDTQDAVSPVAMEA